MIALQARNPQIADPSRQTAQFANMMNMARQQEAAQLQAQQAQQTMEFARNKEGREAALQPFAVTKASSEAGSAKVKYVMDFFETSEIALANSRNPQQAMALGSRMKQMFPEPELQQSIDQTLSSIPQDPNQFETWRQDSLMRTMDAKEQLAREYIKQTTGTEERVIGLPKYGSGAATEVPGSRISVAEGMRYLKTDTGDIIAVPNEKPGSFTTPPPAGGAPGRGAAAGQYGAAIENAVTQLAPGTIVSGRGRTPARNAEVGGVSNSYHLDDNARDLQPAKGQSLDQLAAKLAPLKQQGFDVIIERRKNHVHVEPGAGMARGAGAPRNAAPSGPTVVVKGTGQKNAKSEVNSGISPEKRKARDAAVQDLYDAVVEAQKKGHLTSDKQSYIANRVQELRQGRPYIPGGTAQKTSVDTIEATASQLLRQLIEKGTSGTLNAVAEQKLFLRGVGAADSTYETRLKTIRNFARQNGVALNDYATDNPQASGAGTSTPVTKPPPGISAAEWNAMDAESRKLWK
jgi:hypothetical protein